MWRHGDGRGHLIHPVLQWRPNVASKLQDHHRDERLLKVRSRNEWNMELDEACVHIGKIARSITVQQRTFEASEVYV